MLQRLRGHGATPDHGLVLGHQKADRHDLYAIVLQRLHGLAVGRFGAALNAHHHRQAGSVDIGVQQSHLGTFGRQGQRQVHRRGAFAHATFARGNRHHVFDARQQLYPALYRMGHDVGRDVDRHIADTGNAFGGRNQRLAQIGDLAFCGITQLHVEGDVFT